MDCHMMFLMQAIVMSHRQEKGLYCLVKLTGEDHALEYYFSKNKSIKPMTIRDYFGSSLGVENYYRHPRNYNRRAVYSIDEPSPTIRGLNRPIPKGYKGHKNDTSPLNEKVRPLTTQERAWI